MSRLNKVFSPVKMLAPLLFLASCAAESLGPSSVTEISEISSEQSVSEVESNRVDVEDSQDRSSSSDDKGDTNSEPTESKQNEEPKAPQPVTPTESSNPNSSDVVQETIEVTIDNQCSSSLSTSDGASSSTENENGVPWEREDGYTYYFSREPGRGSKITWYRQNINKESADYRKKEEWVPEAQRFIPMSEQDQFFGEAGYAYSFNNAAYLEPEATFYRQNINEEDPDYGVIGQWDRMTKTYVTVTKWPEPITDWEEWIRGWELSISEETLASTESKNGVPWEWEDGYTYYFLREPGDGQGKVLYRQNINKEDPDYRRIDEWVPEAQRFIPKSEQDQFFGEEGYSYSFDYAPLRYLLGPEATFYRQNITEEDPDYGVIEQWDRMTKTYVTVAKRSKPITDWDEWIREWELSITDEPLSSTENENGVPWEREDGYAYYFSWEPGRGSKKTWYRQNINKEDPDYRRIDEWVPEAQRFIPKSEQDQFFGEEGYSYSFNNAAYIEPSASLYRQNADEENSDYRVIDQWDRMTKTYVTVTKWPEPITDWEKWIREWEAKESSNSQPEVSRRSPPVQFNERGDVEPTEPTRSGPFSSSSKAESKSSPDTRKRTFSSGEDEYVYSFVKEPPNDAIQYRQNINPDSSDYRRMQMYDPFLKEYRYENFFFGENNYSYSFTNPKEKDPLSDEAAYYRQYLKKKDSDYCRIDKWDPETKLYQFLTEWSEPITDWDEWIREWEAKEKPAQ